ncbi:substrate-binding domain-containing protein [Actinokineospora auranticolor]|uniref:Periplasmic binding family protein n=1 Tax=Actinokineospora auranticolor TaxID=155976 RepID=A0A2S6GUL4_9PSEU|nr:substrate-binding domain-containing protein [Actinokineospora auranticolor]PPK68894.1 periplasmic binding family protein [Actinokineospora auranticolor]
MRKKQRLIFVAAAAITALGLAANAAQADPAGAPTYRELVGVGSDTTQTVLNGLADAVTVNGVKVLGSYDARGTAQITTKDAATNPACTIARPENSGGGVTALKNDVAAGTGCVQFARSSSNSAAANPDLKFIPFAVDALTYAVRSDSTVPKKLTKAQLTSIYTCANTTFKPLAPQFGSGTRSFFIRSIMPTGTTDSATLFGPGGTYPCVTDKDATGEGIQEHVGTYLTDTKHLLPYSIAVYNSQVYGNAPAAQGKAVLGTIDNVQPTNLNTTSVLKRDVYNVIPANKVTVAPYSTVFVGGDSLICARQDVITRYGFGVAPNCGQPVS